MLEFLATVQKSDKFVTRAVEALAKNDIVELEELEGANIEVIKDHVGNMSGGLHTFLETAFSEVSIIRWPLQGTGHRLIRC